jgi:hypothetical protein
MKFRCFDKFGNSSSKFISQTWRSSEAEERSLSNEGSLE